MIRSLNRVSPSEYLLPIVSAWVDMAYSDMAQRDVLSFGPEDRLLVYVNKGGELRSALVWCYYADDASARVLLGYTWPPYRSRGLYTALYARMRKEAKKLGANKTLTVTVAVHKSRFVEFTVTPAKP